ncbi:MAG: helix-turn-helix domain-containing protein [Proteobacteria bacterium]|jgi:ArsR family transcriptional regulator, arsenate/arsenite/antimonite-responsive transcriptional repressor|nr:helix-turn-helix domain-containing protein [Pseudomonadota bacterium]
MDKKQTLDALSALSQETRLDVFRLLMKAEPEGLRAGDIAERLGVLQNTMSANLGILERAGLIRGVREGRSIRYVADLDSMRALLRFLMEDCCGGQPELCAPLLRNIVTSC